MAQNKTQPTTASVADHLAAIEDPEVRADCAQLVEWMQAATGHPPVLWGSIVGFGRYHYRYESGREGDFFRVGFARRKRDLTLYVMPGFDDNQDLRDRLGPHRVGKSCLYIKRLAAVDTHALREIIDRAVAEMQVRYPE